MQDDGSDEMVTFSGMWLRVTYLHSARQQGDAESIECAASSVDAVDDLDKRGSKVSQNVILCNDSYGWELRSM